MPIREKKYYRIGEVSKLTGVEAHVLRYWENEFPQIKPRRVARQRLYRHDDIETIRQIKELLYEKGFTIAGAKKYLQKKQDNSCPQKQNVAPSREHGNARDFIEEIKKELISIQDILTDENG